MSVSVLLIGCSSKEKNYDPGMANPAGGNAMPVEAAADPTTATAAPMTPAEPLPPLTPEEIGATINYTVKTGDSLWLIAKNHKSSIGRLKRINQLTGDNIRAGQVLKVPSSQGKVAAPVSKPAPAATKPSAKVTAPASGGFRRPSAAATPPTPTKPKASGAGALKIQD
ncbi:MAG: LysM peptidoglycan-binding domain-containing protein [Verrucomicrobiales bacterium]|nr:LysM peptidoglycan-binding domain-containing protein [Verrucomicrobiales bacterium]